MTVKDMQLEAQKGAVVGPVYEAHEDGCFICDASYVAPREKLHGFLAQVFGAQALRPYTDFDDSHYFLPPSAVVRRVFDERTSRTAAQRWRQIFDCEDFAYSLKADFSLHRFRNSGDEEHAPFAVGILWGGQADARHVVNFAVTCDHGKVDVLIVDTSVDEVGPYPVSLWKERQEPAYYILI